MEHYITDYKCVKIGHIFEENKNKPNDETVICEYCLEIIDKIPKEKDDKPGYY